LPCHNFPGIQDICANRHAKRICDNGGIRKDSVEEFVLDELYNKVLSKISILDITERLNAYNAKMVEQGSEEIRLANKELNAIRGKIDKLLRLVVESGISPETITGELKRLEESKAYLENRIAGMEVNNKIALFSEDITVELLERSREAVKTRNMLECRSLLSSFIESVLVYEDRVDVKFKVQVPDTTGDNGLVRLESGESIEGIRGNYKRVG
jgi:site-specific DNA recombinase